MPLELNKLDPNFKNEIVEEPGGENIKYCFQCSVCSASCPVLSINENYNPRKIIRMALLGMKEEVLSNEFIWLCSSCYTCHERCPQNVKITEVMNAIKNIAVRDGYPHPSMKKLVELIREVGRAYKIGELEGKKRAQLNLPEIQPREEEIEKIFRIANLDL